MRGRSTIAQLALLAALLPADAGAATLISVDLRDVDVYDAARLLATQAAVNIVVDGSVLHRPVTLRLQRVSFDVALATFTQANSLATMRIGDIIYLGTPDAMNRRYANGNNAARTRVFALAHAPADGVARQMIDSLPAGTLVACDKRAGTVVVTGSPAELARASELVAAFDRSAEVASATFPMHFIKSAEAVKALSTTLAPALPSTLYASEQQNAVIASGPPAFIERARALVEQIDRPGRQVRYDVRVADLSPSESSNVGVVFGGVSLSGQATPGQVATAFVRNSLSLNATINALVTKGEASILAQPSLSTLNNVQASLLVGQQFPVVYFDARTGTQQVQFVNVGVNLTVSPSIGDDGAITTELQTDYSTIVNFVNNFPIIGTRKAQSTLRVMDGETIVIAGLFQELDAATISKVPILGDLPLFGELFKNRTRSHVRDEIVFMVTPHLVAEKKEAR